MPENVNTYKRRLCFVTTTDNPWNPITEFGKWYQWEIHAGYNTLAYVGKFLILYSDMPDKIYDEEVERVCDEIVKSCPLQNYKKVVVEKEFEYEDIDERLSDEFFAKEIGGAPPLGGSGK